MKNQLMIKKVIVGKDGKRYLPIEKSGIPVLFILMDGVVTTHFEKERQIYISLEEILKWYEKEIEQRKGKNKEVIKQNIKFMKDLMMKKLVREEK